MMSHVFACLWVFFSQITENEEDSFILSKGKDMSTGQ